MKKLVLLTLLILAFSANADAQKTARTAYPVHASKLVRVANRGTAISGVILPLSFSDQGTCGFYVIPTDEGYVAGTNEYVDKEKMMAYNLSAYGAALPATLDTAYVHFGAKHLGSNGNVLVKIYGDDGSGSPGALLGTSVAKSVSSLDTSGVLTRFTFANRVSLTTNKYFVSVDISALYATGDSLGILSTEEDCVDTDPMSAWEKFDDGTTELMSTSWPITLDMGIYAYITANAVGINNVVKNTFSASAYPLPATSTVTISFVGQDNANTILYLKDITGKTVASSAFRTVKGSSYKVPFAVNNLSSGMYFVEIASGVNKGMLKVSVQ